MLRGPHGDRPRHSDRMPVMKKGSRRLFALVAAFAVAFGALWPLVSVAAPRSHEIPNFLCTQSGFQHSDAPANHDDKFHCPLCVMSMDSAPPAAPPGTHFALPLNSTRVALFFFSSHHIHFARPPPSRAPPL